MTVADTGALAATPAAASDVLAKTGAPLPLGMLATVGASLIALGAFLQRRRGGGKHAIR